MQMPEIDIRLVILFVGGIVLGAAVTYLGTTNQGVITTNLPLISASYNSTQSIFYTCSYATVGAGLNTLTNTVSEYTPSAKIYAQSCPQSVVIKQGS